MIWAYDAASATIYDLDNPTHVICRDVDPAFGALIAAAGEMRAMLRRVHGYLAGTEADALRALIGRLLERTEGRG